MTKQEQVARALRPEAFQPDTGSANIDKFYAGMRERAMERARTAIEAMRKPTEAMVKAGYATDGNGEVPEEVWAAMIDAALKEGT